MEEFEVTIAVINYNTKEWLDACLKSVTSVPPLAAHEIYVIDNGSTDGSADFVHRHHPDVHLIENAGNLGFSAAANQALRTSHAKYVLILNTDTEVDPEAIDILVEFGDANDQMGAAGPLLLNTDGTIQLSGRRFPSFLDATMHAFLGIFWPENPFSVRYRMLDWDRQSERTVDWVSGAAMFIRREAARDVNFFDERFFMYVEDMDLCNRLWHKGWKVYFCPEARVIHHLAKSSEQSSVRMIIEFQRSLYRFYAKSYTRTRKVWLKPLVAVGLTLRAAILIARAWIERKLADRRETPVPIEGPESPDGWDGDDEREREVR